MSGNASSSFCWSVASTESAHRVHVNNEDSVVAVADQTPRPEAPEAKDASNDEDQTAPEEARGEMMHEGDFEDPTTTVARRIAAYIDQICLILCPLVYALVLARLLDGREVSFEDGRYGEIVYSGQVVEGFPPAVA